MNSDLFLVSIPNSSVGRLIHKNCNSWLVGVLGSSAWLPLDFISSVIYECIINNF